MTKISNYPHKNVLCLKSLNTKFRREMIKNNYNPDDTFKKLKGIGVDVCDLTIQNLSKINQYRLVIIICHHIKSQDIDALVLGDNTLLPVDVFVHAISTEFTGLLDLAICQSREMAYEIKALSKYPDALKIQYAEEQSDVEFRCFIYPDLLKNFSFDPIDNYRERYRDAYRGAIEAAEREQKKRVKDPNSLPEGTKLGTIDSSTSEKRVSVSSQKFVRRNYSFPLYVCLHYDLEKEEIDTVIKEQNHDADDLVKIGKLKPIQKEDEVKIKLSMLDHHKHTTDLITVCDSPSTFTKTLTICEEYQKAIFDVLVTENYSDNEFWSRVEVFKDSQGLIEPFCIKHTILTEEQYTRKIDVSILFGQKSFTGAPKTDIIEPDSEYLDLKYFTRFDTLEKQNLLRDILKETAKKIDVDAGRDWVALYIAYSFYSDKLKLGKRYVNFFTDIESLLPDTLTKIRLDETGDKRYRSYTESLAGECGKWFIEDDCLPSMNEWKSCNYRYRVTDDRKRKVQHLVADIHKKLKQKQ